MPPNNSLKPWKTTPAQCAGPWQDPGKGIRDDRPLADPPEAPRGSPAGGQGHRIERLAIAYENRARIAHFPWPASLEAFGPQWRLCRAVELNFRPDLGQTSPRRWRASRVIGCRSMA